MNKKLLLTLAGAMLLLSACGKTPEPTPTPNPEPTPTPTIVEHSFTFDGTHCTCNNEAKYEEGKKVTLTITADEGYSLPKTIAVIGSEYTYDNTTGKLELTITADVKVLCIAYIPNLYISKMKYDQSEEVTTFEQDGNNLLVTRSDANSYYANEEKTYFENGLVVKKERKTVYTTGELYCYSTKYEYKDGLLIAAENFDNDIISGHVSFEYDELGRKIKESHYSSDKLATVESNTYVDENTVLHQYDMYGDDGVIFASNLAKTITMIDEENGTKTEKYYNYHQELEEYYLSSTFIFDLKTNHELETVLTEDEKYIYTYNEYGNLISFEDLDYDEDTMEYVNYSLYFAEYNDDQTLRSFSRYYYNTETKAYDILVEEYLFESDEDKNIVKEIYNSYSEGVVDYTYTNEYEFIKVDYVMYIDDFIDVNFEKTISANDYFDYLMYL